ncbi:MBL fold metallo-hydrolase [Allopusillimonas ginsengisoli]|uniref:MBL fold metallo-hydrolase n=1 Tax=Allopusillimonas ginsengisoli TaxID=453575 RepID=UPI0039C23933
MSHIPSPSQAGNVSYQVLVQGNCLGFTGGFLGLSSVVLVRIEGIAPILFDTGHHATKAMLIRALAGQGLAPKDVGQVFLSHLHFDHANNVDLFPNAELIVSREEWAYAQNPAVEDIYISAPVVEYIGRRNPVLVDDGDQIHSRLTCLATPGHTAGHMALYFNDLSERRVVLAGDSIKTLRDLTDRRVDLEFDPQHRAAATIAMLAENFDVIIPGHSPELCRTPYGWSQQGVNKLELVIR